MNPQEQTPELPKLYIELDPGDLDRVVRAIKQYEKKRQYARDRYREENNIPLKGIYFYNNPGKAPISYLVKPAAQIVAEYLQAEGLKAMKPTGEDQKDELFSMASGMTGYTLNPQS